MNKCMWRPKIHKLRLETVRLKDYKNHVINFVFLFETPTSNISTSHNHDVCAEEKINTSWLTISTEILTNI